MSSEFVSIGWQAHEKVLNERFSVTYQCIEATGADLQETEQSAAVRSSSGTQNRPEDTAIPFPCIHSLTYLITPIDFANVPAILSKTALGYTTVVPTPTQGSALARQTLQWNYDELLVATASASPTIARPSAANQLPIAQNAVMQLPSVVPLIQREPVDIPPTSSVYIEQSSNKPSPAERKLRKPIKKKDGNGLKDTDRISIHATVHFTNRSNFRSSYT